MPNTRSPMKDKDIAFHLHSFTNPSTHEATGPQIIEKGEGIYLTDTDGQTYIDGMSSLWCCSLGFSETRLINAAYQQFQKLPYCHTFRGRSHPNLIELAESLVKLAPTHMSKVFFANSGSEANDTAIKLAWHYNKARGKSNKSKIIARQGGYHGSTVVTASLSGLAYMHTSFNLPVSGIIFTDCPHYYRYALESESEEEFANRLANNLEQLILQEGADTIAAFIAEPVMGVGGVIVPPKFYFQKIQEVLRKYDILMIADEVICGFGRTGYMFGSETFGIEPDMMTMAKGLSSAYFPISALMISDEIYGVMVDASQKDGLFAHGLTYSGHPVGAAIALEALSIYREKNICSHVRDIGKLFDSGLQRLLENPIVGEVRSAGLMGGIELVADKNTKESFAMELDVGDRLALKAEKNGLFIRSVGSSLVIAPPLIITRTEMGELLTRLSQAIEEMSDELLVG